MRDDDWGRPKSVRMCTIWRLDMPAGGDGGDQNLPTLYVSISIFI